MTPPLYRYVKGQGWVPNTEPIAQVVTMACGTRVTIEMREPLPGEYWDCGTPDTFDEWARVVSGLRLEFFSKAPAPDYTRGENFCTLTVLAP